MTYLLDRRHELAGQLGCIGIYNVRAIFCCCNSSTQYHIFSGSLWVAGLEIPMYFQYGPSLDIWLRVEYVGSVAGFERPYRNGQGCMSENLIDVCSRSTHQARPVEVSETRFSATFACHLLSLPREIRDMIVENCLDGSTWLLFDNVVPPHNFRPAYASLAGLRLSERAPSRLSSSSLGDGYPTATASTAISLQLTNNQLHHEVQEGIVRSRSYFPRRYIVGLTTHASEEDIRSLISGCDGEMDVVI